MEKKFKKSLSNSGISLFLFVLYLLPLYILLGMSLRTIQDLGSKLIFPKVLNLGNYIAVFKSGEILMGYKNSIIIVFLKVAIEIIFSAMGAYGIARSKSKYTKYIRHGSMAIMMIPGMALLVGTYSLMVKVHLSNSLVGLSLLLSAGGMAASMFLYTNFIVSIPVALDEAAYLDGASVIQTFFKVIMPQLKAITVTRIIMSATGAWNQYIMPMYLLQDKSKFTVIQIIKSAFSTSNGVANIPRAAATCVVGILPIIIMYLFLQKYIIEGQLDSAVK